VEQVLLETTSDGLLPKPEVLSTLRLGRFNFDERDSISDVRITLEIPEDGETHAGLVHPRVDATNTSVPSLAQARVSRMVGIPVHIPSVV